MRTLGGMGIMDEDRMESPTGDDWESRTLCSDGNCIGVIGPDGLCKECGRPYSGGETDEWFPEEGQDDPGPVDVSVDSDDTTDSQGAADEEWEARRLCPDGNCIGVIGPDGRCKECGLPYAAPTDTPDEEPHGD